MIAALLVLALQGAPDALGSRLAESAQAAQALQGPLDGGWVLTGVDGEVLYRLQISDAPDQGPLGLAWSAASGAAGVAKTVHRTSHGLTARLAAAGPSLELRQVGAQWRGWLAAGGHRRLVRLRRKSG